MAVESTPGIESSEFYFNKVVEFAPTGTATASVGRAPRGEGSGGVVLRSSTCTAFHSSTASP